VAKRVRKIPPGTLQYSFQTPPVQGVEAEKDYTVELKLLNAADGMPLASYRFTIRSEFGQDILPDQPLTVGPGYEANPEKRSGRGQFEPTGLNRPIPSAPIGTCSRVLF
jgi:hypothetical protein